VHQDLEFVKQPEISVSHVDSYLLPTKLAIYTRQHFHGTEYSLYRFSITPHTLLGIYTTV